MVVCLPIEWTMKTRVSAVERIRAAEFDPLRYPRGGKISLDLQTEQDILLPVLLTRGATAGKTLVVTAGVHGDEFEGVRAILEVCAELSPETMKGDVIAVPVANPPAFWNGTRVGPLDGDNLARAYPGDLNGSPTSVLAFHLAQSIIRRADFYLDLHSAGVRLLMPNMVGYDATDPRSSEAAQVFGAPVIWGHPRVAPGRTVAFASSQQIPWLYTEARGAGHIDATGLAMFKRGMINLMRYLQILPGRAMPVPVERVLWGDGDLDVGLRARCRGLLVPSVELLQTVKAGEELGRTLDLHGKVVELFRAPYDGVVAMIHAFPMIQPEEVTFLVIHELKGDSN